eukprot:TRINITY_DN4306_c0_g1_i1.p1 TRINITY_DN4306_c0_g1~~TRINITY_DN4306_c0_g1_i1.p1  ORF type:complete len:166 (-),score=43.09 TRINITY_DN4306_c0_g1_i1:59-556(-)
MQTDGTLPAAQRRNYTGVGNALTRIVKEEGFFSLWKGCAPTVYRAMALNLGMLATNDQAKEYLQQQYGKNFYTTLGASAIAGFFASFMSLPFDFVKTRVQKMKPNADGTYPYKNTAHAAITIAKEEGLGCFYRGFTTYYFRIAPHVMITLVVNDYLLSQSKAYFG